MYAKKQMFYVHFEILKNSSPSSSCFCCYIVKYSMEQ